VTPASGPIVVPDSPAGLTEEMPRQGRGDKPLRI
jgi:hypothetical protein